MNPHFVELTVLHCRGWKHKLPVACSFYLMAKIAFRLLPVIEVTDKIDGRCIRRPFTEHPSVGCTVQPIVVVSICEVRERLSAILRELAHLPKCMFMTSTDCILIRSQVGIILYESDMGVLCRILYFRLSGRRRPDRSLLGCSLLCCHGEKALCFLLYFIKTNLYSVFHSHNGRLLSLSRSCPVL